MPVSDPSDFYDPARALNESTYRWRKRRAPEDLPLELRLRGKSTTQSHRAPIYFVDLTLRAGQSLHEAVEQARAERAKQTELGVDQAALDEAARRGFAMGAFEDVEDDGLPIIEEFFPDEAQEKASTTLATNVTKPVLRERLTAKTNMLPDHSAA